MGSHRRLGARLAERFTGDPVHRAAQRRREVRGQSHLNGPLTWQGSTLVAGDLAQGVTALKERHDEVHVIGSLDLLQSLLRLRLVDRMNLWLYPLLLGSGKQVFAEGTVPTALGLIESVTYPSGALHLGYETAGAPSYGNLTIEE